MWAFERQVAWRFLKEGRFQSLLIVVGVAAGVAVIAYITALVQGLQRNTLEKTLGTQAHVVIRALELRNDPLWAPAPDGTNWTQTQARSQALRGVGNWQALGQVLADDPAVAGVSPMLSAAALARRGEALRSVLVTGVDLNAYARMVGLAQKLKAGALRLGPSEALIGVTLAEDLGLQVGDRFRLQTPTRSEDVQIMGTVDLGVRELNRRTVLVPLRTAQTLMDLPGGVTEVDVSLHDVWQAQRLGVQWARQWPYAVESWQESNAPLVSALSAQSVSTVIIRAVVMVVVVLGIASVLVVSVVQKQREIGILRAMGVQRGQVLRLFLMQGAVLGVVGSLLGVVLAAGMVWGFTHFVKGPDGKPLFTIALTLAQALEVATLATVAGVLAAWAPARRASALDPAQAIRS